MKRTPTRIELLDLYKLVRRYVRRERAGELPLGDLRMVRDWHRICRAVGIDPKTGEEEK